MASVTSPMGIRLLLLLSLISLTGCTSGYSVAVKNQSASTLTLALTKDGPPFEQRWASPEEIIQRQDAGPTPGFATVYPTQTGRVNDATGTFGGSTHAILRIYRGDLILQDMLAIKPGRDRQDIVLKPGANNFTVRDDGSSLRVEGGR